jgi:hypothetical protein
LALGTVLALGDAEYMLAFTRYYDEGCEEPGKGDEGTVIRLYALINVSTIFTGQIIFLESY